MAAMEKTMGWMNKGGILQGLTGMRAGDSMIDMAKKGGGLKSGLQSGGLLGLLGQINDNKG
jgi:hypothetical protein